MKFLHISDVHLGCTRYHLKESPRDFFNAWIDVLQKYAIDENVDFIIMCGDFFHKRSVPPETMNYAFAGLDLLRKHNIPVASIEGNHDQHHIDSDYSWLRSLANWKLLYLLEPNVKDGKIYYEPWNPEAVRGGFLDLGRARIFGSFWFGTSANSVIPQLTELIAENRRDGAFHILLLHTDVTGYQTHPIPALTVENLKKLKSVTDYVGLGHTHKCYEIDNWAFNPGSLEITKIDEFREVRGAWLVEVGEDLEINAKHIRDYTQRPFQRISFDVSGAAETTKVTNGVLNVLRQSAQTYEEQFDTSKPIIEIKLHGHLGFPNSSLQLDKIRREAKKITKALHIIIKNLSVPIEYAVAEDVKHATRESLEKRVLEDLIFRDTRYRKNAQNLAATIIEAKRMVLNEEPPENIMELIAGVAQKTRR